MSELELAVLARGHAAGEPVPVRNGPSFYADPAAWLVVAAITDALGSTTLSDVDDTGVIVVSAEGSARTMGDIAAAVERGRVSPLRFAGSNPAILAGLACIVWKLRGPSILLAMRPAAGLDVAGALARAWLRDGQAHQVIVAAHEGGAVRCLLLRAAAAGEAPADLAELLAGAKV
jgi:hypothetical protein